MGAWYLHELSLDEETPLDHFMMFSSVASLVGNFGQANYSAANSCLDALTEYRRSKKLAAQSIQWGPWIQQGMAVELKQHLDKAGMRGITNDLVLRVMGDVMRQQSLAPGMRGPSVFGCQGLKWATFLRRYGDMPAFFSEIPMAASAESGGGKIDLKAISKLDLSGLLSSLAQQVSGSAEKPPIDAPLMDLGLDSLGAVEFRNSVADLTGVKLPQTLVFENPTIEVIADFILDTAHGRPTKIGKKGDVDKVEEVSGVDRERLAAAGDAAKDEQGSGKAPSSTEVDNHDMTVEGWLKSAFSGSKRYLQYLDVFEAKYPSVEAMAQETDLRLALDVCQVRDEEDFRRLHDSWDKMRSSLVNVSSSDKLSPLNGAPAAAQDGAATDYDEAIRGAVGGGKPREKTVDPMDDIKDLTEWLQFDVNTLLPMRHPKQVKNVLLTGVTGFVGRLQVVCLLDRPGSENLKVTCLVRANDEKHAMQRIRDACNEAKVWKEEYASRIEALPGDFTKEDLGVGEDKFVELCRTIDMVHHTGGNVNLLSNYARLRATNTLALKGVLRLCTTYRLKSLHHVSTLGIFPAFVACFSQEFDDRLITEDSSPDPKEMQKFFPPLRMGYPWSKWAAEQVLRKARDMGLPVCVYRLPSTFVGWRTGYTNKDDFATALTVSSIEEGMFPVGASTAPFTPVDTIAEMLVEASFLERRKHWLYHLIDTTVVKQGQLEAWADELGIKYYGVKIDTFLDAVKKRGPESPVFKFVLLMQYWRSYWFDCDERTEPFPIRTHNIFDELPHMAWPPVKDTFRASFQYQIEFRFFAPKGNSVIIDADHALEWARKHTDGLRDFATEAEGEDFYLEPARLLAKSANQEVKLSFLGELAMFRTSRQMFKNLLFMKEVARLNPEIERQQIRQPLIIVGLDRMGATLLQRLIAQDPAMRAPMYSEMYCPYGEDGSYRPHNVPNDAPWDWDQDPRLAPAQEALDFVRSMSDDWMRIHAQRADWPDEDYMIFEHCFRSYSMCVEFDTPAYKEWLFKDDCKEMNRGYAFHKRFLQHLQWQRAGNRWLLNMPFQLFALDALFETYPNALVVHVHRSPKDVVASWCSLVGAVRKELIEEVDLDAVGQKELEVIANMVDHSMDFRAKNSHLQKQFLDVHYDDLINGPMEMVKKIYRHFKIPMNKRARDSMWAFINENKEHKDKLKRSYALEEVHLTEEQVRTALERYYDSDVCVRRRTGCLPSSACLHGLFCLSRNRPAPQDTHFDSLGAVEPRNLMGQRPGDGRECLF
ncbi:unnamed protein product [Vitrella brassicaformis CCMP3155]|uniref:Carrier domain-containing protein n=1 Tax=Vitrella brassicaformis (strain CCMP3155) TaxID=1169540 RepID=A0A0G4EHZ1_VITBC|nr:unnamed protein product [Vitrella brassicaformis CCMP3155]|eukprot:CEL95566.1 unnamed protein product [Vitrella brassicaformis CCMP3155]